jgi:transcriptional regulator with GAF, ATPase, and Fis domain
MQNINREKRNNSHVVLRSRRSSYALQRRMRALQKLAETVTSQVEKLRRELGAIKSGDDEKELKFYDEVQRFEISLIQSALEETSGHQLRAARLLGLNASTLSCLIKRYNIPNEWNSKDLAQSELTEAKDQHGV